MLKKRLQIYFQGFHYLLLSFITLKPEKEWASLNRNTNDEHTYVEWWQEEEEKFIIAKVEYSGASGKNEEEYKNPDDKHNYTEGHSKWEGKFIIVTS